MSAVHYLEVYFKIDSTQNYNEVLLAELQYFDFESFVETEKGIKAYIRVESSASFEFDVARDLPISSSLCDDISYEVSTIEQTNWNAKWEENFDPIYVEDQIEIRAPFHETKNFPHQLIITPKMSFGTGHHQTTQLMLRHILALDLKQKRVLDMGSGTGVLGIFALKKEASEVIAVDIEPWCIENCLENAQLNAVKLTAIHSDCVPQDQGLFDVVIANINRNVLLEQIKDYRKVLNDSGVLLMSGFYKEDLEHIEKKCAECQFKFSEFYELDGWIGVKYVL